MEPYQTKVQGFFSSILVKMFIIGFLVLILLIPAALIRNLINEREQLKALTELDIQDKWGKNQTLTGPMLTIPYYREVVKDDQTIKKLSYIQILPDSLEISGTVIPEVRYRSIYRVVVYTTRLGVSGYFHNLKEQVEPMGLSDIQWDNIQLNMGISDLRGIENELTLFWNGQGIEAEPGIAAGNPLIYGVHIPLDLSGAGSDYRFELEVGLRGSGSLFFTPMGKTTIINLESDWPHPGFDGAFLPYNRNITKEGFDAQWTVLHYNRNFPQIWDNREYSLEEAAFGVNLLFPVDEYRKNERSVKYAILFLLLTFTLIFFIEVLYKSRVHPAQYLMVGASLLVFYVLLLSLSEQIGFQPAFLIAAVAIIIQIVAFIQMILQKWRISLITAAVLAFLYGYLYVLLQLQDYALLLGSVGLFVILGVIMYLSGKINWYKPMEGN